MKIEHTFTEAEPTPVRFKCQVHPWMTAYMGVFDHPYFAVSNAAGQFSLHLVPPGEYQLVAWHEKLGTQTSPVTVQAGQTGSVNLTFPL